ncbi:hypothetical protein ACVWWO_000714 [Bradyrhizobium sp. F1.13.1]
MFVLDAVSAGIHGRKGGLVAAIALGPAQGAVALEQHFVAGMDPQLQRLR